MKPTSDSHFLGDQHPLRIQHTQRFLVFHASKDVPPMFVQWSLCEPNLSSLECIAPQLPPQASLFPVQGVSSKEYPKMYVWYVYVYIYMFVVFNINIYIYIYMYAVPTLYL